MALVGVRIPSRQQHTRDLVVRVYEENPHLQRADLLAVTRYAELSWKFRKLAEFMERMGTSGFLRKDLEPRKILAELRGLAGELLRHEAALGITVAARASLGVDIGRMKRLGQADQGDGLPEADVEALEQRIVRRLSEGQQPPQDGQDRQEGAGGV